MSNEAPRWMQRVLTGYMEPEDINNYKMSQDYEFYLCTFFNHESMYNCSDTNKAIYDGLDPSRTILMKSDKSSYTFKFNEMVDSYCNCMGYPGQNILSVPSPLLMSDINSFFSQCKKRMELAFTDSHNFRIERNNVLKGKGKLYGLSDNHNYILSCMAKLTNHYKYRQVYEAIRNIIRNELLDELLKENLEADLITDEEYQKIKRNKAFTYEGISLILVRIEPCVEYESNLHEQRKLLSKFFNNQSISN